MVAAKHPYSVHSVSTPHQFLSDRINQRAFPATAGCQMRRAGGFSSPIFFRVFGVFRGEIPMSGFSFAVSNPSFGLYCFN
jgi:hypothetical protein